MDILYPLKQGDNNGELRCSLRSLKNIKHDKVFVCGYKPYWLSDDILSIPVDQNNGENKYIKSITNLIEACKDERLSDNFILMNDDMYIMKPLKEIPVLHRGPMTAVINDQWAKHQSSMYTEGMIKVFHRLQLMKVDNPTSYELHVPIVVNKKKFLKALEISLELNGFGKRTLYGNMFHIGGEQIEDVKYSTGNKSIDHESLFISTEEASFMYKPIGRYIRDKFNKPCKYEKEF